MASEWAEFLQGWQIHVAAGGLDVMAHRALGGLGIAVLDGLEDGLVMLNGRLLANPSNGQQTA